MKILNTLIFLAFCANSAYTQPDFAATIEGPLLIDNTPGHVIMKAADGSYWTLTVNPSGQMSTIATTFTNIDVTIANTETYVKDVFTGDEEGVSIFKQAQHYSQSEIIMDATTNWENQFRYTPKSNFVGQDKVTILFETGSDGASPNTNFSYLTIKFTVTN